MSEESRSDAELTLQLKEGSQEALAKLFGRYRSRLAKIIRFRIDPRVGSRVSELDVLQDVYVRAVNRIRHFSEAESSMSAFLWFRLLAGQQLAELHRRHVGAMMRDVRKEVSIDVPFATSDTSHTLARHLLAARLKTPSEIVGQQEELDRVETMLKRLSEFDQEMIALRHFEELTNAEAADVLQLTPATARKRYLRAMHRLKARMNSCDDLTE